jgi:hypothetical protein
MSALFGALTPHPCTSSGGDAWRQGSRISLCTGASTFAGSRYKTLVRTRKHYILHSQYEYVFFVDVFIYGSFNNAVSSTESVTAKGRVSNE